MSTFRAPGVLALLLIAAACTSPARTDTAALPSATTVPTTTTVTVPPETTTTEPTLQPSGPDVIAWLAPDAAATTLSEAVAGWAGIGTVHLIASDEALAEFIALHGEDDPNLVKDVSGEALPASLRIELSHPSYLAGVAAQLRSLSDVAAVDTAITPVCNPFPGWNIVLFVDDDRQLTRLRNQLATAGDITDISVIGREEAYGEYLERFAGIADLSTSIVVQDMSVSIRGRSTNPVTLSLVRDGFEGDRAVKGIQVFHPGSPACH